MSKFSKLAAAAVIIIAAVLSITFLDKFAAPAYGITDVPELFQTAKTIHMKGRMYFPTSQPWKEQISVETEYWLDIENGRWRLTHPGYSSTSEGMKVNVSEKICDGGEYEIAINHTDKTASYGKISEYQRSIFNRRNINTLLEMACGQPELFDDYAIVGREEIGGDVYDIWEALIEVNYGPKMKLKSWLSPATGEFARIKISIYEDGNWVRKMEIDSVERNIKIPDETFSIEVPSGYMPENSKDTATANKLSRVSIGTDSVILNCHILFTMADGSVIVGWSSEDRQSETSQAELFENLEIGAELPKLPFEVYALSSSRKNKSVTYKGFHLAYTQKAGEFYEWGIYVPAAELKPEFSQMLVYRLLYRDNIEREVKGKFSLSTSAELIIKNAEDFDTFVLGAMAELSDDGKAPEDITYEAVLQLAEQIRQLLAQ